MGTILRKISDKASYVAKDETWMEGSALQQLETTAKLHGMQQVVGMPDLHPGRGYPVGAGFFSTETLYPALVGNDIGCGMALWQTELSAHSVKLDKLDQQWGNIDTGLTQDACASLLHAAADEAMQNRYTSVLQDQSAQAHAPSLGTIGGGNHFAELLRIEQSPDPATLNTLGINAKALLLMVHSGSRGLGQSVLSEHLVQHGHQGLAQSSPEAQHYLKRHQTALDFALLNRYLIAKRTLQRLRSPAHIILDVHHNFVQSKVVAGLPGWLHRKGATPSDAALVLLPGSRGDYSYLLQTIAADSPLHDATLHSLPHGAGRKWQRSECEGRLNQRFKAQDLTRTALGSRVLCGNKALLFEEAPQAYKPVASVLAPMLELGLVKVLARLKPVLTYKTRGRCCE